MSDARRKRLSRTLPATGGVLAAIAAWIALSADDGRALATVIAAGGVAVPDGRTLVVAGAAVAGVVLWATLYLIWGPSGWLDGARGRNGMRRPLSYNDLGPPPPREQPLPTDLDQPLSAFDPEALLPGVKRRT